ncbi:hypothetical protein MLD63_11760 [Paracoccus sp. TK19116]|uniref:Periplasmic protein-like protein n=1 Tax=Paracoccus albicereus TaxID=2922394 RepID=A0ABT1MS16_9RHOB|nr:hypothetical protein [Paracoccus albicereus]MCQ0971099.1 hypothetical protein [Paracoccus albicereus]
MRLLGSPAAAIRAVLLSQVILGAGIVWMDVRDNPGTAAPGLFAPEDGPGVRPYRPDLRPAEPGTPAMRPMPKSLEFDEAENQITISGQIAVGDADRFAAWLEETRPAAREISLDSSGGSVADALAIGRTIRGAGYDTIVEDGSVCLSACPYLLAGGVTRRASEGATVGVHQHYFGKNTVLPAFMAVSDVQRAQASVMDYLTQMGVDLRLMVHALRTAPKDINVLSPQLMNELGLTTSDTASS